MLERCRRCHAIPQGLVDDMPIRTSGADASDVMGSAVEDACAFLDTPGLKIKRTKTVLFSTSAERRR
eukprot:10635585-Alexandrium_andersonii.AAC.1